MTSSRRLNHIKTHLCEETGENVKCAESKMIGNLVMEQLKSLIKVAYVRLLPSIAVGRYQRVWRRDRPAYRTGSIRDQKYGASAESSCARRRFTRLTQIRNVGCVIVKDGGIVGEGFHLSRRREPRAEVHALRMAGEKPRRDGVRDAGTLQPSRA